MSKDPRDKEEEFIAGLAEDTGRDLAQWMAMIDAQTFAHRNDMIDWLRQRGLTFAKASRLERIHHNGGKPVYAEKPAVRITPAEIQRPYAKPMLQTAVQGPVPPLPSLVAAPQPPPAVAIAMPLTSNSPAGDLATFLARAKGYRPLAELLIRSIRTAVPATLIAVHDTHADLAAPVVFGALAVTAKDVRLALDLGEHPFAADIKRLRLPGVAAALNHTIVLNDARRIDNALMTLVAAAAARANS